jgi:Zn-dependent protease
VDAELVQRIALLMPALLVSLAVHEYAHAWSATRLGDSTPSRQGRLTLSPIAHLDIFGSLIFPLLLLTMGPGFLFGWARPVEFNPAQFTRKMSMRGGQALTAAAGPLSNVLLAFLSIVTLRVFIAALGPSAALADEGWQHMVMRFLEAMFYLNVLLAVFNLFPLPPLDGHHLLPRSMDDITEWLRNYSFILFIVLFFIPIPGLGESLGFFLMRPVMNALSSVLEAVAFVGA